MVKMSSEGVNIEYMKNGVKNKDHVHKYNQRYRKENPDKIAAAQERYWLKITKSRLLMKWINKGLFKRRLNRF